MQVARPARGGADWPRGGACRSANRAGPDGEAAVRERANLWRACMSAWHAAELAMSADAEVGRDRVTAWCNTLAPGRFVGEGPDAAGLRLPRQESDLIQVEADTELWRAVASCALAGHMGDAVDLLDAACGSELTPPAALAKVRPAPAAGRTEASRVHFTARRRRSRPC